MSLERDIQTLDPGARVELFEIDATLLGGEVTYMHAGTGAGRVSLVWQGNTYTPWPIFAEGFEWNGRGQLPTPRMRVANIGGLMTAQALAYDDLVGAKVTRHRTLAKYLDGQPDADPTAEFPLDIYFVERKVGESRAMIEWELASAFDVEGVLLPRRQVLANMCSWVYRGPDCGYDGVQGYTINNVETSDADLDVCPKSVEGCKTRHGRNSVLPFGGFPAAGRY